jgi:hypothetical protein
MKIQWMMAALVAVVLITGMIVVPAQASTLSVNTFITPNLDYSTARVSYTYQGSERWLTFRIYDSEGRLVGSARKRGTNGAFTFDVRLRKRYISGCETLSLRVVTRSESAAAQTIVRPCFGTSN